MTTNKTGLSDKQLEAYEREGYIVLESLLGDEDMAPPREAMMEKTVYAYRRRDGVLVRTFVGANGKKWHTYTRAPRRATTRRATKR